MWDCVDDISPYIRYRTSDLALRISRLGVRASPGAPIYRGSKVVGRHIWWFMPSDRYIWAKKRAKNVQNFLNFPRLFLRLEYHFLRFETERNSTGSGLG